MMPGPRAWPRSPTASSSRQLLSAASLFQLDALQRHCEILCSQTLSVESAVNTYKYAKVRTPAAAPDPITHPALPWQLGRAVSPPLWPEVRAAQGWGAEL